MSPGHMPQAAQAGMVAPAPWDSSPSVSLLCHLHPPSRQEGGENMKDRSISLCKLPRNHTPRDSTSADT